jgi:hypothetical protein
MYLLQVPQIGPYSVFQFANNSKTMNPLDLWYDLRTDNRFITGLLHATKQHKEQNGYATVPRMVPEPPSQHVLGRSSRYFHRAN